MSGGAGQSASGLVPAASRTVSEDLFDPASQYQLKAYEDLQGNTVGHREGGSR